MVTSLRQAGVDTSHILQTEGVSSAIGNILLEVGPGRSAQNRIIVVPGANMSITPEDLTFLEGEIQRYDMVLLQLEIPMDMVELVARLAHEHGVPVMLNPAPAAPLSNRLLANLTYISPNEHEAALLTGVAIEKTEDGVNLQDVKAACGVLLNKGVQTVIITLGDKGCALMNEREFYHLPCHNAGPVADPTAAAV